MELAGPSTADIDREVAKTLLEELPAEENVFPTFLRPHAFKLIGLLLLLITVLILVQIGLDLYYLLALHQNLI